MSSVNSIRIPGLATGMDTDQMVKDMLTADQNKVDKAKQANQITKWKQEQYRDIISDIKGFSNKYFDVLSKDYLLGSQGLSTTTVKSSNSSVVSAVAGSNAISSNYTFDVEKLATSPTLSSTITLSKDSKLSDLGIVGEKSFKIGLGGNSSSAVITIDENDTVESMINKMNEKSGGKYTATYSEMTGKFSIKSNTTGENSELSIIDVEKQADGSFVEKGTSDSLSFLGIDGSPVKGENAIVKVKDSSGNFLKEINSQTNVFTIDGVTYDVKGIGSATLETQTDTTKAVESIKQFVEDYNKLVGDIYKAVTSKKDNDYPPLTEAQKKEMSKEEIEKWEEKAKVGHLRNDNELRRFLNDLSDTFRGALTGFGIEVSKDYSKPGQLTIDMDKLTNSLKTNPMQVTEKLKSTLENTKDVMNKYVGGSKAILVQKSGMEGSASDINNVFSKEIKRQEDNIKALIKKMNTKENSLYKKFAKLESNMSKLNSQMNYLLQQS